MYNEETTEGKDGIKRRFNEVDIVCLTIGGSQINNIS